MINRHEHNQTTDQSGKNDSRIKKLLPFWKIAYQKEDLDIFFRTLIVSTIAILFIESIVMILLVAILKISEPLVWFVDGLILVIILFPLNYFFIILPVRRQIEDRNEMNKDLVIRTGIIEGFFNISDSMLAYLDPDFNFIRVNAAYAKYNQQTQEYFIGKNHFDLFPNEENKAIFTNVINSPKAYHVLEKPFSDVYHPEFGTTYWDWSLIPTLDDKNNAYGLILALVDRTEPVRIRLALEESERRFRGAFDQTFLHLIFLNIKGQVVLVNQSALEFLGGHEEDLSGKYFWDLTWWEQSPSVPDTLRANFQKALMGNFVNWEFTIFSNAQERQVMDITLTPLRDDDGNTIFLLYEAHNITERIEAERQLQLSMETINALFSSETRALHESETLRAAALTLSSRLSKETVLDTLLDELYQLIPFTSAHLYLVEDENHLLARLVRGDEDWDERKKLQGKLIDINAESLFKEIMTGKTIVQIQDTDLQMNHSSYNPGKQFVGSWVGFPLLAGEQVVGLCVLEHRETQFFTSKMVELATTLTNQAAIAIQNAWLYEQVQNGRMQVQALAREIVKVQEEERQYIARELHDEAGQSITSIKVGLSLIQRYSKNPDEVVSRSNDLKTIADEVLENLHRLAVFLRPALLDHLGLIPAMRQFAENVCKENELSLQFDVTGELDCIPNEAETAIYRITQEALTNIIRHAHAKHLDILITRNNGALKILIEDDGVGFDPMAPHLNRLGLVGMNERALMLGGTVRFEKPVNGGTRVVLEVPCQSAS